MRVLILGAAGMLGHALFLELSALGWDVFGSVRDKGALSGWIPERLMGRLSGGVDVLDPGSLRSLVDEIRPGAIINCVGLVRQRPEGRQALPCVEVNSRFPHLLARLAREKGARMIHYGTDCVFDGRAGRPYLESDFCSASDVYGLSKFLGEVSEGGALTLRTSIIGHELLGRRTGLLEWLLGSPGPVGGYTGAVFSGLTAVEHARILSERVLPRGDLAGLYQVASKPISKYDLLRLVAKEYCKDIVINPDESVKDDKRMSMAKFAKETGYAAPDWPTMIRGMRESYLKFRKE